MEIVMTRHQRYRHESQTLTKREMLAKDWPGILCLTILTAMLWLLPPPAARPVRPHMPVASFIPPSPVVLPEFEPAPPAPFVLP
jgi:hypothetical protein